jgi:hypothetical protein
MDTTTSAGAAQAPGSQLCAARMAGHPVSVEYTTGSDDGQPFVNVLAVHIAGRRIPAHWFAEDAIADFERECEAAEMACADDGTFSLSFDEFVDAADAASRAEDQFIAQRDHAHYSRAAA